MSKYIGETEKNLRQVFDAAESGGAVLLFDEADAIFGKRSEVRDSHDRYANIEVSYLLQRMERYRGVAILTTNLRSALDDAFLRRLRFVVTFPFPDFAQREAIWARAFPAGVPHGRARCRAPAPGSGSAGRRFTGSPATPPTKRPPRRFPSVSPTSSGRRTRAGQARSPDHVVGAERAAVTAPLNVEIDAVVIERSPGHRLQRLSPDLRHELLAAGVPVDLAADVARAVLDEVCSKVDR